MHRSLRLLNPRLQIASEAEAVEAARFGAIAAFVSGSYFVVGTAIIMLDRERLVARLQAAMDRMPEATAEAVPITESMIHDLLLRSLVIGALFGIAYVVLGVVQWRKQTRVIPLLLLLSSLYSLLGSPVDNSEAPSAE